MNPTRQIVILIPLSAIIFIIGRNDKAIELPPATSLAAWGLLLLILLLFADFSETGSLAASLAWLITLTVFLSYSPSLFTRINKWIGA